MNLRYIERDGKLVLQQEVETGIVLTAYPPQRQMKWQDVPTVPVHKEPEEPKKPREFQIVPFGYVDSTGRVGCAYIPSAPTNIKPIHVTEVPKGYRLISRDELLQAYGAAMTFDENSHKEMDSSIAIALIKVLGFDE